MRKEPGILMKKDEEEIALAIPIIEAAIQRQNLLAK